MRRFLLLFALSLPLLGQDATYNYFAETGISYDYYAKQPALTTGFGLRIGNSNAFSVTDVDSVVANGVQSATLRENVEYHIAAINKAEFLGVASAAVTTSSSVTLGNFAGGFGLSYDIGKTLTKNKISIPLVFQFRMNAINGVEVKPVYQFTFRKTF